jgi:hypothetical protein
LAVYPCDGLNSIVASSKFIPVLAMNIAFCRRAWVFNLISRHFSRIELQLNPELRLDLNSLSDHECISYFCFSRQHIHLLVSKLEFPDVIITYHHDRVMAVEEFCLVLRHLAYLNRWFDLKDNFGHHASSLSRIMNYFLKFLLLKLNQSLIYYPLTPERLQQYAAAFHAHGVPNGVSLWSVIDTKKSSCENQRALYSGHKRIHCLKYQTLEAPDGLFLHVTGCFDGRRGDRYILRRSGLINFLRENDLFNGFFVLVDSAYPNNDVMLSIYRGRNLPLAAQAFNMVMCPIRTCVEWGYAKIV